MLARPRAFLFAAIIIGLCTSQGVAQDGDGQPPAELDSLKAAAAQADAQRNAAAEQVKSTTEQLQQLERELLDLRRELKKAEQSLKSAEENLPKQQEAAKAALTAKEEADKARAAAEKALAEAQKQAEEALKKANESAKQATEAAGAVAQTEQTIAAAKASVEAMQPKVETLAANLDSTRQQLAAAEQTLVQTTADWVARQQAVEGVLREAGQWVSFREEIAPILNQRCVACHNTRTAKGRLNLESYAALMKGGESGASIDPGDGESSTLCLMIDDGSMPKDAEPLTQEQIALIQRWVTLGAQLDAGVNPDETLIRIMPRQEQPPAPEQYNVPIPVTAVAISPDGTRLATSGYHEVLLWNLPDGTLIRRIGNIAERIADLEFHPDGDRLAIAAGTPGQMGEAMIVKTSDGSVVAHLVTTEDAMFAATFSPDGNRLAACGADRAIRLFDVTTGEEQTIIEDHADWVMDIAWSSDGTRIASASRDKTSKLFDAATGDALQTFNKHGEVVFGVTFLPDGKSVATSGRDKKVRLWTVEKADQTREIGGFGNDVFEIAALPDGHLISCSADKTVRLHNSADGKEVRKFEGHSDWVYAVAAHPGSKRLVSGSFDGEIRVWNLDTGESVLTFKAAPGFDQVAAGTSP